MNPAPGAHPSGLGSTPHLAASGSFTAATAGRLVAHCPVASGTDKGLNDRSMGVPHDKGRCHSQDSKEGGGVPVDLHRNGAGQ